MAGASTPVRSRSAAAVDPTYPLEVLICEGCGLAQLRHTVAPDALFGQDYFYFSSYTQTVLDNAKENVEAALARFRPGPDALVVELASNDGYLLKQVAARGVRVLGIDPAPHPVEAFLDAQAWMTTLPTHHDDGLRHYVHAGVRPGIALQQQDDQTRLWIREEFLYYRGMFPRYIVHGHTPTILTNPDQHTPEIRDNRCNVDTGAGAGAALSAAVFDDRQPRPVHTVSTM